MKTTVCQCLFIVLCLGYSTAYANPDLVIVSQKVSITRIDQNRAVYAFRILNNGTRPANLNNMRVALEISRYHFDDLGGVVYDPFATVDYTGMRMTSLPPVIDLPVGQFVDIQAEIAEPNLFRTRFWLSVELNSNNAVSESINTNNQGFGVSTNPNVPSGQIDLRFASQLHIRPLNSTRTSYSFLLLNDGNVTANLQNMEITTELSVNNEYQVINREKYMKMRYDSPANPASLAPGKATLVKFKLLSGGHTLPGFYYLRVTLNTNQAVSESDDSNNSKEANSIGLQ